MAPQSLQVIFWLPRDNMRYQGIVTQCNRQLIVFETPTELRAGNAIYLVVIGHEHEQVSATDPVLAKVVTVERKEEMHHVVRAAFDHDHDVNDRNRRKEDRHPTDLPGLYTRNPGMPFASCRIRNISRHGMRLEVDKPLKIGDKLIVQINADKLGGSSLKGCEVNGRVCNVTSKAAGVFYIGLRFMEVKTEREAETVPPEGGDDDSDFDPL